MIVINELGYEEEYKRLFKRILHCLNENSWRLSYDYIDFSDYVDRWINKEYYIMRGKWR